MNKTGKVGATLRTQKERIFLCSVTIIEKILIQLKVRQYKKQAGTGPSRRHIQGSKIAKRLPSVKYSLLQYSKIENFSKKMDRVARAKVSQCRKTERGDPLGFFNIHSVAKHQKIAGGPFVGKFFFRKKSLAVPKKNERGDPLVSPGMVYYAEKQEKPFWFSSLGQIVQFGAIIFCRTFKNYFGQFVWIEKKESL